MAKHQHSHITSHLNNSSSLNQTPKGAKDKPNSTDLTFSASRARKEQGTLATEPMQPLTSSKSSTVPATLQPDGAWKRPAHTGPSLVEAPEGLQSPYCTRPPRWVQKQERRARRDRAPIRPVPVGLPQCMRRSSSGERREDKSSIIAITIAIQSEAIPAKNGQIKNLQQENWLQGGDRNSVRV